MAPLAHATAATASVTSQPSAVAKFDRKAFKHELKRQLAAAPKDISAEGKSQLVAVLLCFFLGGLGIHDFYMGYVGKGIIQIILTLLIVGFILVIIDFIRLLTGSLKPKDGDWGTKL
ncbi:TM2 domain-containing protein [Hymenobacter sp. UV11]|nr:TM2 domain-containing protein [Hymenobacter sp. UV11]